MVILLQPPPCSPSPFTHDHSPSQVGGCQCAGSVPANRQASSRRNGTARASGPLSGPSVGRGGVECSRLILPHYPPPPPLAHFAPRSFTLPEISGHTKGFKARSLLNATVGEGDKGIIPTLTLHHPPSSSSPHLPSLSILHTYPHPRKGSRRVKCAPDI